jgi:hypothetical protein
MMLTMSLCGQQGNTNKTRDLPAAEHFILTVEKQEKKIIEVKIKKSIKEEALQVLTKLYASNGGNAQYGDIPYVVNKFHNMGYSYVTRGVLSYMLSEKEKQPVDTVFVHGFSNESNLLSLTGEETHNITTSNEINVETVNNYPITDHVDEIISTRQRPKPEVLTRKKSALIWAATLFQNEQAFAKLNGNKSVANGTLRQIISSVERD